MDTLAYGMGWKGEEFRTDINDVLGDHPTVFGWDLGHLGDEENIDGVPFEDMKLWAISALLSSKCPNFMDLIVRVWSCIFSALKNIQ